jgi:hypothetical protein
VIGPWATPAPSWPVAIQRPSAALEAPIAGRPPGSQGRRPAQAASTRSAPTPGASRAAARSNASLTTGSTDTSKPRRSRLEPTTRSAGDPSAPFGGFKASGVGREHGRLGLDAYLENKTVWVNLA